MSRDWTTLGRAVRARRTELDLAQGSLRWRGGPSRETVRMIEVGERDNYRDATFTQLDLALDWRVGTAASILDGAADLGDPDSWVRSRRADRDDDPDAWARPRRTDVQTNGTGPPLCDECGDEISVLGSEDHFVAAEQLLEQSKESGVDSRERDLLVAQAQVHALLALFR